MTTIAQARNIRNRTAPVQSGTTYLEPLLQRMATAREVADMGHNRSDRFTYARCMNLLASGIYMCASTKR